MSASAILPTGVVGRYAIHEEIASGGMATVHLGRRLGPVSFSRTVAIKRLHAHLAREPEFVAMFLDEARLAARVRHPNVVPTLDVVTADGQPFLVMEYVQGVSLARLLGTLRTRGERVSVPIACSIVVGMLQGLHAAHEATNERGESLGIVHRDISPQNVMVGLDGVARVLDFGVAKASGRLQTTREGQLKGKLGYTAPELIRGRAVTRAADIYSSAVVLWETLTGDRLFAGDNDANVLERALFAQIVAPSERAKGLTPALDPIVLRALDRDPARRFATAREMARAIEAVVPIASAPEVGEWVETLAGEALAERAAKIARIDDLPASSGPSVLAASEAAIPARRGWPGLLTMALGAAALGATLTLFVSLRNASHAASSRAAAAGTESTASTPRIARPAPAPPSDPRPEPPTVSADELPTATSSPKRAVPANVPSAAFPSRPRSAAVATGDSKPATAREISAPPAAANQPPAPAAKSGCDPPWKVDARGIKQYKLECL
jgi:hypothetical protein